jgi:hypothetical protein
MTVAAGEAVTIQEIQTQETRLGLHITLLH